MTVQERNKLNYLVIKSLKVFVLLVCCCGAFYCMEPFEDKEKISRWIVPVQIIQILYLVVVVYFIVNTGKLMVYLVCGVLLEIHRI
jgi:uncharacterized membrane protein HdeD (DUF308 family)